MKPEELTGAFESLQKLEHHYKSQYEDYLAKAMSAKANLDRLEPLLKDLSSQLSLYPQQQESFLEFEPEPETINGGREQLELDWMGALVEDTEPEQSDDKTETQEISHREFMELSPQVMPILGSIFAQDVGKKLHLSYLHKAVNQESLLGLSQDTVGLFLEEAIALGYCDRDIYDKQCYYSVPDPKTLLKEALRKNPSLGTLEEKTIDEEVKEKQQQNQEKSVTLTQTHQNLPPSPRVKMSIPDTIMGYITEYQPKTFTPSDVLNYLYSNGEQKRWSKAQKHKVIKSIRGGLSNGNNKNWRRLKRGVYQPLLPKKDDSNSIPEPEKIKPSTKDPEITNQEVQEEQKESASLRKHHLPVSPKVKTKMLDTLLGYIAECHPKTFTPTDVLNYLYSDEQQNQWTETQADKILTAISNGLHYYSKQKQWRRVRVGVYRP